MYRKAELRISAFYLWAMNMPENLRKLRMNAGLSQARLAERLGTIQKVIADYEVGRSEPSATRLLQIARFFGVTIDEIIGAEDVADSTPRREFEHGNRRLVQLEKLFQQLSVEEQRTILKQLKALVAVKGEPKKPTRPKKRPD